MSRCLATLALLTVPLAAQIFPETWREHRRTQSAPLPISDSDQSLFKEYGGEATEKATYRGPAGTFTASAWRLPDSTSALAWFQAIRPENGVPIRGSGQLAVTTPGTMVLTQQNYVLQFEGWRPTQKEMTGLFSVLPKMRSGGGLPVISTYLPETARVRNSERYILGPTSLARFEPRIPPVAAGFELGAEAQMAKFRVAGAEVPLLIFNFPTPQIARSRVTEFEKLNGWTIRRSSSYVTLVPQTGADAEKLADSVNYGANFIWNQATKLPPLPDVAGMLLAIFELTGVLLLFCLGGGVLLAGVWVYWRHRASRLGQSHDPFTALHLGDRS